MFSVVVPAFNEGQHITASLESILLTVLNYGKAELIVVDNGSTDGSFEIVSGLFGDRLRLDGPFEGTVAAVRNRGVRLSRGDILVFLDADCVVGPQYLDQALAELTGSAADATGCKVVAIPDADWIERTWWALHAPSADGDVAYINSGNFIVTREAFQAVGGFDIALETGEDSEFCARLRGEGFRIYQARSLRAIHLGNPKTLFQFARREMWHGVGALGTFRHERFDRPLLATVAHMTLTSTSTAAAIISPSFLTLSAVVLATMVVPFAAVVARVRKTEESVSFVSALALYWTYFGARGATLVRRSISSVAG